MNGYISIAEAARLWGLTPRRVQGLCQSGELEGAVRFGRAWAIPSSAERPKDRRTRAVKAGAPSRGKASGEESSDSAIGESELKKELSRSAAGDGEEPFSVGGALPHLPLPRKNPFLIYTDLYSTAGEADAAVEALAWHDEAHRLMRSQLDYHRGDIDKIYKNADWFLRAHSGFNAVISGGVLLSLCALWRGDISLWRKARQHIYETPCQNEEDRRTVSFWLAAVDSAVLDISEFHSFFRAGIFENLPRDSHSAARVFYAKYLLISATDLAGGKFELKDVKGLGLMRSIPYIIEPMLSYTKIEGTLLPEIYMHLIVAAAYHNTGDAALAVFHTDAAIALSLPDGLLAPLVECRESLGTLLDERLALVDPDVLARVRNMHKEMYAGWLKLHNLLLERNVSSLLTAREREVAKLAVFGLSNAEIAERLHIELSSVKRYIFSAMNKVGAEKRTELRLYI